MILLSWTGMRHWVFNGFYLLLIKRVSKRRVEIFNELNELVLSEWFSFPAASNEKAWLMWRYCSVESKTAREKASMRHMLPLMRTLSFATPQGQTLCKRLIPLWQVCVTQFYTLCLQGA